MIKKIWQSATLKQSSITMIATVINGGLGALFYILAARFLGPEEFGVVAVSISFLTMISDIADLGVNTGLVKFVSFYSKKNSNKAYKFLKLGLEIKVAVFLIVGITGVIVSPFLAKMVFNKEQLTFPLQLAFLGLGGSLLFSYITSSLQSMERFIFWGSINILSNLLRLTLIILLFQGLVLNVNSTLLTYISVTFLAFFAGIFFLPFKEIISEKNEKSVFPEMFGFSKNVAIFIVISAVSSRLDTFIGAKLLTSFEIGIYAAANQLTSFFPQIISAIGVVVAPKFASFDSLSKMMIYFKKLLLLVTGISVLSLFIIPLGAFFIPLIYGSGYTQAFPVFAVLILAMIVFLISVPIHNAIIYYFGKSDIFIWISIGNLIIMAFGSYFLIQGFGLIGGAYAVLAGTVFNLIIPAIFFVHFTKPKL